MITNANPENLQLAQIMWQGLLFFVQTLDSSKWRRKGT